VKLTFSNAVENITTRRKRCKDNVNGRTEEGTELANLQSEEQVNAGKRILRPVQALSRLICEAEQKRGCVL
jgi:hypothetical protein